MDECELQYTWSRSARRAYARMPERLADLTLVMQDAIEICDTYLDTTDGALARAGERLRVRDAGAGRELTRKGPAQSRACGAGRLRTRAEESVPLRTRPLAKAARRAFPHLAGLIGGGPLVELGQIHNLRTRLYYGRKGRLDVEVTIDRLTYSTGGDPEIRIEAEAITAQGAKRLARIGAELEAALGRGLGAPARGKVRELIRRSCRAAVRA